MRSPRSGGRKLAGGYTFFVYPREEAITGNPHPRKGVRGLLAPLAGCGSCRSLVLRWYAKNAYHRLISYHRSAVRRAKQDSRDEINYALQWLAGPRLQDCLSA